MYRRIVTKVSDDILEIKEYHPGRYGAPGERRKRRKKPSPEAVEKQNRKLREKKMQMLMLCNFREGYHVILKYPKGVYPESYEKADQNLTAFLKSTQRAFRGAGRKFHYIAVTERGKRKAVLHHHLIVQNVQNINMVEEIRKRWKKFGVLQVMPMYEEGDYKDLAAYIVKAETKEEQKGNRYHISRGLKKPEVIRSELVFGQIKDPAAPDGWSIEAGSLVVGKNPVTGKLYQNYFIKRCHSYLEKMQAVSETEIRKSEFVRSKSTKRKNRKGLVLRKNAGSGVFKKIGKGIKGMINRIRGDTS